jgi:hypothetical protein
MMGMTAEQIQIQRELKDMKKQLLVLNKRIAILESESYPSETKIKSSYIKKIAKANRELKEGKYNTYGSVKELDKAIRSRL